MRSGDLPTRVFCSCDSRTASESVLRARCCALVFTDVACRPPRSTTIATGSSQSFPTTAPPESSLLDCDLPLLFSVLNSVTLRRIICVCVCMCRQLAQNCVAPHVARPTWSRQQILQLLDGRCCLNVLTCVDPCGWFTMACCLQARIPDRSGQGQEWPRRSAWICMLPQTFLGQGHPTVLAVFATCAMLDPGAFQQLVQDCQLHRKRLATPCHVIYLVKGLAACAAARHIAV